MVLNDDPFPMPSSNASLQSISGSRLNHSDIGLASSKPVSSRVDHAPEGEVVGVVPTFTVLSPVSSSTVVAAQPRADSKGNNSLGTGIGNISLEQPVPSSSTLIRVTSAEDSPAAPVVPAEMTGAVVKKTSADVSLTRVPLATLNANSALLNNAGNSGCVSGKGKVSLVTNALAPPPQQKKQCSSPNQCSAIAPGAVRGHRLDFSFIGDVSLSADHPHVPLALVEQHWPELSRVIEEHHVSAIMNQSREE